MHPEMQDPPKEPIPFPELYREERFTKAFDRATYLSRQAGSALFLMRMYRDWLRDSRYPASKTNFYWSDCLVGPLMHLIHVHEMQALELHGEAVERESWYLAEMYRKMGFADVNDHSTRLAIHGVMYLRGLYRYRQVIAWSSISHPWTLWARDAELNAKLCFDVLDEMETLHVAKDIVAKAVKAEEEVMKAIEARKATAE